MTAQEQIIAKYGVPDKIYFSKYCCVWDVKLSFPWFPKDRIFINKAFQAKLQLAFANLQENSLHKEIETFDGCYEDRNVRNDNAKSLHSWACAMDLNAGTEALGQVISNWTSPFIVIMKSAGLFWGGDFIHRKDPMHFALFNG